MMVLTFVTGVVDAVGYLGLDKVFTGNMTGNIVILAMGLAGGKDLPVIGPLLALFAFAAGAMLAGRLLRTNGKKWGPNVTAILGTGSVLLAAVAVAVAVAGSHPDPAFPVVIACLIAVQMGAQACVARKLAVTDMTTVVVTSTLTQLAGESFQQGGIGRIWNRRAGAILAIFAGAGVGALLLHIHLSVAIALGAVLTLVVVLVGRRSWNTQD
jgi:uncharacterized membrane protein YoaK (UPF0700 family)